MKLRDLYWVVTNWYGRLFGHSFLVRFHHTVCTLSLHALGYGNMLHQGWTGEEWFVQNHLQKVKPKVIFDIGANTGEYSKLLLKHTEATIYAFEPNPFSFKDLQELPERVKKMQLALADTKGVAQLNFQSEQDEKASLDSRVRSGQTVDVEVTTIDSFVKENQITEVDFIKIDTEGFEKEVLLGLGVVRPKFIQFEFNDHNIIRSVVLADLAALLPDYNLFRLLPSGWVKVDPKSYIDNIFIFSNYIAVRK